MAQRLEGGARGDVGVVTADPRWLHSTARDAAAVENGKRIDRRERRAPLADGGIDELERVASACCAGVVREFGARHRGAQRRPLVVAREHHRDVAVHGPEHADGPGAWIGVAEPRTQACVLVVVDGLVPQDREERVEHRQVDEAATTVLIALAQRARTPSAANTAGISSPIIAPDFTGGPSGKPVLAMKPEVAWITASIAGRSRYGPSWP